MIGDSSLKQRLLILNLSLITSTLLLLIRSHVMPHSFNFIFLYSIVYIRDYNIGQNFTFVFLLLFIVFIVLFLLSTQHFLKFFERYRYKAMVPLLINVFTLVSLWGAQYPIILQNFYFHSQERQEVIEMIKSGQLKLDESQRIKLENRILYNVYEMKLPPKYTYLSSGAKGEINIVTDKDKKAKIIVFFTSTGKFKGEPNYTALMYRFDNDTSIENHIFGIRNLTYYVWLLASVKINDNWFWVDVIED